MNEKMHNGAESSEIQSEEASLKEAVDQLIDNEADPSTALKKLAKDGSRQLALLAVVAMAAVGVKADVDRLTSDRPAIEGQELRGSFATHVPEGFTIPAKGEGLDDYDHYMSLHNLNEIRARLQADDDKRLIELLEKSENNS